MRYSVRKKFLLLVLFICMVFCAGVPNTSHAEEDSDYSSDEELAVYIDDPNYRIEDGMAIEIVTNTLVSCRADARAVIIPTGVEAISSTAFIECDQLESVIVSEGVKRIEPSAFERCKNLTSIVLPTTLKEVCYYAFSGCNFDTLIIPRNTRLQPNLGQSEWYGVLDGCKVKTLVFCGTDGLFLPTTFGNIKFPADGSGQLVFWGNPPEYFDLAGLQFNYKGGEVESGTFTICYPAEYADAWAPNGETEWNGLPMRALTRKEERKLIKQAPKLFSDEDRTDVTEDPGWSFDQNHNVTIYSEEGWYRYCIANWGMEINDLRFAEDVDFISEYFFPDSPGPTEITMKRLLLPEYLTKADLDHMIFEEIIVDDKNTYIKVDNGRLINPDSGYIVWEPEKPAAEQPASPMPTMTPTSEPTPTEQPSPKPEPNNLEPWIIAASVAFGFIAGAVVVALIGRRKSSN